MAVALHPSQLGTLSGLFQARVAATPGKLAYRQFDAASERWIGHTWSQVAAEVTRWQAALARQGLQPGDRVALMLKNCVEWVIFDQAALGLGLVTVPLYLDDRPESAAYILDHADVRLLFIEGKFQHRTLAEMAGGCHKLECIVSLTPPEGETPARDARLVLAEDWLRAANGTPLPATLPAPDQLASIIYTSGTTGRPKGVMLTHENMLWNAWYANQCIALDETAVYLSFLPLSHTLERTAGYYWPMLLGAEVAYARSILQLAQDLQTLRPTVLISVPRIYERVYARIQEGLAQKKPLARALFDRAVRVGWRRFERSYGRAAWHPELLLWPLLERLVARKVTARLGGRLEVAVSGGAALSPAIARLFIGLGVPIFQGYGLTEASPVVCVNRPSSNLPASIGQPMPGVEVRVGEHDELLTRSRCIMRGYWKNPEATAAVIDADGWLHSGDQVSVDAHQHYTIIGRLKDIIVLSNGEKVPPSEMESAILLDPLFEQVIVVGEGKPYLAALAVLNAEQWARFAASFALDPAAPDALHHARVRRALLTRMAQCLAQFPGYAQIRRLHPLLTPWTVEDGLLTPTLKTRRKQVMDRYRSEIAALYADFDA